MSIEGKPALYIWQWGQGSSIIQMTGPSQPAAGGPSRSSTDPAAADPAALLGLNQAHINSLMQNWLAVYTVSLRLQGLTNHEITKLAFEKAL